MTTPPAPVPVTDAAVAARLDEVEAKLAFAEDLIDTLNATIVSQQARLDLLQQQLRLLHERMAELRVDDARLPGEETPPHY